MDAITSWTYFFLFFKFRFFFKKTYRPVESIFLAFMDTIVKLFFFYKLKIFTVIIFKITNYFVVQLNLYLYLTSGFYSCEKILYY